VRTTLESRRRAAVAAAVVAAAAKVRDQQARRVLAEVYTHEEDVAALVGARRRQMERIEARYAGLIAEQEARRNESLLRLRQLGRSPQRIAEMTGLSLREITRRLAHARQSLANPDHALGGKVATVLDREPVPGPVQESDLSTDNDAEAGTVLAVTKAREADDPVEVEHDAPGTDHTGGRVAPEEEDASASRPGAPAQAATDEASPVGHSGLGAGAAPIHVSTAAPVAAAGVVGLPETLTEDQKITSGLVPGIFLSNPDISRPDGASAGEDGDVGPGRGARGPAARPRARRASPRAASPAVMDEPLF